MWYDLDLILKEIEHQTPGTLERTYHTHKSETKR